MKTERTTEERGMTGGSSMNLRGEGRFIRPHQLQRIEQADRAACGMAYFSVGLGLAELLAPRAVARLIGAPTHQRARTILMACGARELLAGAGLLSRRRRGAWMWSRAVGDAMDLALLAAAMSSPRASRTRLGVATAAVAGAALVDLMAARRLSGGADEMLRERERAGIKVNKSITINRTPEELYGFWRELENLPRFMAHLESIQQLDGTHSRWKVKAPAGLTVEWEAEIIADRPGELIAWRSLEGADVRNAGTVQFLRAPGGRGTEVRVELHYQPPAGRVGSVIAKLFGREPSQQVEGDLRRLKQVMETGEVVHSDASIHRFMHAAQPPRKRNGARLLGTHLAGGELR